MTLLASLFKGLFGALFQGIFAFADAWMKSQRDQELGAERQKGKDNQAVIQELERHADIDSTPIASDAALAGLRVFTGGRNKVGNSSVPPSKPRSD